MPIGIKKLGQKGGPKGQDKTMPLPKKKPRHASPKHRMNTEKTKSMAEGGKLKMVEKGGKKVPFFAADGVGKMMGGGMMKKKMSYKVGGPMKKGPKGKSYAEGGPVKVKSGDTLSQIAKKNGLTLASLMAANPGIKNANQIRVGQSIKMPTGGAKSRAQGIAKKKGVYGDTSKPVMSALARDTAARKAAKAGKPVSKAKTVKDPKIARKIATTATKLSNLGQVNKNRRADDAAAKASRPDSNRKPSTRKTVANTPKSGAAKVAETRMARLANKNKTARRMGGGSMKKVQGYTSGGVVRGAGAATSGKRYGRAG